MIRISDVLRVLTGAALLVSATAGLSACTPVTAVNGFIAVDTQPTDIQPGSDTRSSVLAKLGSPSTTSTFDSSTWYYITQISDKLAYLKPVIKSRHVVSIRFDAKQTVAEVKTLELKDGYDLSYEKRETPTRGKELNWLEQLLGNIGRGGGLLPQDNDPGQRPGGGSSPPH